MSGIAEIQKAALALPVAERVLLAQSLLDSFPPADADWSEAQELAEAERRHREIESGPEFKAELRRIFRVAASKPGRSHLLKPGLRRAKTNR